jgi:hypothetical protein
MARHARVYEDLLYQTLRRPGAQSSQQTRNQFDEAVNREGFFQMQTPKRTAPCAAAPGMSATPKMFLAIVGRLKS